MKNIFKLSFLLIAISAVAISCAEDEELAPFKPLFFSQGFELEQAGFGSNEVPIDIEGWSNFNLSGPRVWSCKEFNDNQFAEFSSFYSSSSTLNDEAWMITSKIDFTLRTNETLTFDTQARFSNGAELKVLVSTDFDGTQAGITTATWVEKTATLPTVDNVFVNSGYIDLSDIESNNVYIAFKYIGSKPQNKTTTFQVDKIKLFENK